MSRLRELVERFCPDGVEYRKMGSFCECFSGATPKKSNPSYWEGGTIPWMSSGEVHQHVVMRVDGRITQAGYDSCSTRMVPAGTVVVALAGQGKTRGTVAITKIDLCTNQSIGAILCDETVDSKYLYYYLSGQYDYLRRISSGEGTRGGLNMPLLRNLDIPVPPLEVQREVVRILDSFQELDDALTAEIEAREKQWDYLRERNLRNYAGDVVGNDRDMPMARIGDLYVVTSAKRVLARDQTSSGVPFLKVADFIDMIEGREVVPQSYISEAAYEELESMDMVPEPGDILITARGTVGRFYVVEDGDKFYFQDGMITWLRKTDESPIQSYFDSVFSSQRFMDNLIANCSSGTVKYLSIKGLADCKVPALTAEEQAGFHASYQRLSSCSHYVRQLKAERDARRRQFAHYRDRLLSFPEREA